MELNMYIDGVLIESVSISFENMNSLELRQKYLEGLSSKLTERHLHKIIHTRLWPEFFLEGVSSKMNSMDGGTDNK